MLDRGREPSPPYYGMYRPGSPKRFRIAFLGERRPPKAGVPKERSGFAAQALTVCYALARPR
jgi:hypothetical protein